MNEDSDDPESVWAHVLWQRRGLRIEEFMAMSFELKCVYIASEIIAGKNPQNSTDALIKALSNTKFKK